MITRDFQTAIVSRLENDAYFTQTTAIEVRAERRGFNTKKAVQDALNDRGILIVVSYAKKTRDLSKTNNEYLVYSDVSIYENPKQNDANDGGTGRNDGELVSGKAEALLRNHTISYSRDGDRVDPFSKIQVIPQPGSDGIGYLGERDSGIPVFGFRAQSKVSINAEDLVLGDPDAGFILVTENSEPLLASPFGP